jgi:hypothetical protein
MLGSPQPWGGKIMGTTRFGHRRSAIALSIACAFALPLAAHAQSSTSSNSSREQQLETRVNQLEQQLAELKAMIQEQKAATQQATATASQAQATAQATAQAQAAAPVATVAATPATAAKPTFTTMPGVSVALHGFISASAFSQNRSFTFGNGQNAEFPIPKSTAGSDGRLSGVDVRNTRFWLDFTGGKFAGDWTGGGRIEMDFFGGFNGTGAYAQQQPIPRLRQAYMDLVNPETGTTVRIGQMWDLMFPIDNIPASLSHIAFPLGFGSGMIGWRFPGVIVMQDLNHGSEGPKWRFDLGVFEGSWSGPNPVGGSNTINYLTAGNAGFRPQVEARVHVQDKDWLAFFAAHYSTVDLRGVNGLSATPVKSSIVNTGYELSGGWTPGPWMLKGLVYTGNGLGQLFGALSQFGDINETGGYVQAGYKFTPNWTANLYAGMSKPNEDDVIRWLGNGSTGLLKNRQAAFSLTYSAGAYDLGVEYIYSKLDSTTNGINRTTTSGNQVSLNGMYKF